MSEHDVIEQLGRYGAWIEDREGVALRPGAPRDNLVDTTSPPVERLERGRALWLFAAAAILVASFVGVGWLASRGEPSTTAFLAADPPGALFVLPDPESGFSLTNGSVMPFQSTEVFAEMAILGTSDGDSIRDLVSVSVAREQPRIPPTEDWVDVETAGGTARHPRSNEPWTLLTLQSGDWWLTVTTGSDRLESAIEVLDGVQVTQDGAVQLSADLSGRLIERVSAIPETELAATYAEAVPGMSNEERPVVETATAPSPLISVAALGGEISRTTIRGLPGWHLKRTDADGEWNGLAWRASPNRIIAVSGHTSLDQIRLLAESLRPVDRDEWITATDATTERGD